MATLDRARRLELPHITAAEAEMARTAQRLIVEALDHSRAAEIRLTSEVGESPSISVPPQTLRLIAEVLGALSEGRPITVMSAGREFSTVEAANFLKVSRPFVIKEIQEGRLPHRMVGTHRRIAFEDLMQYATKMRENQKAALERMAEDAANLGLDY